MKKILLVYLFGLAFAHFGFLGPFRYFFTTLAIGLILIFKPKFHLSANYLYNIGGVILISGAFISTVINFNGLSLSYLIFISVNFLLYPLFSTSNFSVRYLKILLLYLFITFIPFGYSFRGVVTIYDNPNNFATVVLSTSYLVLLTFDKKLFFQLTFYFLLILFIFLSTSRTQLASILVFGISYYTQRYFFKKNLKYFTFLTLGLITWLYVILLFNDTLGLLELIQESTYSHKSNRGLSYRDVLVYASLDILDQHPFGVGLGQSGKYIVDYIGEPLSPHNMYFKTAVEGGWIMLVGYIIILIGIIYKSNSILCNSFMIAITIRGFFESSTPFTISMISGMMTIPLFLNENTIDYSRQKLVKIFPRTKKVLNKSLIAKSNYH